MSFFRTSATAKHFAAMDKVIAYMAEIGRVADILPFDSSTHSYGTPEQDERFLRYLLAVPFCGTFLRYMLARYAAYLNVIWCVTNEWQRTGRPKEYLNELGRKLRAVDPWLSSGKALRPSSIHPLGGKDNGDHYQFGDEQWPVHVILRTGRGDPADPRLYADMVANRSFGMPVVNDEFGYTGDSLWWSASEQRGDYSRVKHRQAMWAIYMAGAYASIGDKYAYDDGRPYKSAMWHEPSEYEDVNNLAAFLSRKDANTGAPNPLQMWL